jgi:hypothetical protein
MIVFRSGAEARAQFDSAFLALAGRNDWYIRSPWDDSYQCIAWAACRTDRVWWPWDHPSCYWPPGYHKYPVLSPVPKEAFVEVFEQQFGYRKCGSQEFEFGYQKVAIFANDLGATHMARQHLLGRGWLSKAGQMEDIIHRELTDLQGSMAATAEEYGKVAQVMKRSWWVALLRLCLFRAWWANLRFWLYRKIVPWDLT